jgi:hypothetical protein
MTDFSPATQAILHEFWGAPVSPVRNLQIAAALRAAADHIDHDWSAFNCIDSLYEIAAELEGVQYGTYRCELQTQ